MDESPSEPRVAFSRAVRGSTSDHRVAVWGKDASTDEIVEWLDPAGGVPDDGQERNWDGQTREEFLEMLQESHDNGNVLMENDVWMVEEDAVIEVGAEEVARLRASMEAYLREAWAELEGDDFRRRPE